VVQVDHLGQAQAIAPATSDYQPTEAQIAYHLARFIEDIRGLPVDPIVLREQWPARLRLSPDRVRRRAQPIFARTNDPFAISARCRYRSRSPASSAPSPDSFRVAWIQRGYENGSLATTERWTAILTVVNSIPHDATFAEESARSLRQRPSTGLGARTMTPPFRGRAPGNRANLRIHLVVNPRWRFC